MKIKTAFASLGLLAGIFVTCLPPVAFAGPMDKETIVTFPAPVEIPGRVLPAGTYVFEVADNGAIPDVVAIYRRDDRQKLHMVAFESTIPMETKVSAQA